MEGRGVDKRKTNTLFSNFDSLLRTEPKLSQKIIFMNVIYFQPKIIFINLSSNMHKFIYRTLFFFFLFFFPYACLSLYLFCIHWKFAKIRFINLIFVSFGGEAVSVPPLPPPSGYGIDLENQDFSYNSVCLL